MRSRDRLIPIADVYEPLVNAEFPERTVDRARSLLRLFHKLDGTQRPPPVFQSTDYTPGISYFSHRGRVFQLCHSLLLEKRHFESAANVALARAAVR